MKSFVSFDEVMVVAGKERNGGPNDTSKLRLGLGCKCQGCIVHCTAAQAVFRTERFSVKR